MREEKLLKQDLLDKIDEIIRILQLRIQLNAQILDADQATTNPFQITAAEISPSFSSSSVRCQEIIDSCKTKLQKLNMMRDLSSIVPADVLLYLYCNYDRFSFEELHQIILAIDTSEEAPQGLVFHNMNSPDFR